MRRGRLAVLAVAALALAGPAAAQAARAGSLDRSFGKRGIAITSFKPGAGVEAATAITPLRHGRVLTAGDEGGFGVGLARYLRNGQLDTSWGSGGKVIEEVPSSYSFATGMAIAGGRIAIAGGVDQGGDFNTLVEAFHAGGARDLGFGNDPPNPIGDGISIYGLGQDEFANAVAIDGQGRILAAGLTREIMAPYHSDFACWRLKPDGSLDTSFNGSGSIVVPAGRSTQATSVIALPGGKSLFGVVAGHRLEVVRLTASGVPDGGFGTGSVATIPHVSSGYYSVLLARRRDGRILVAGTYGRGFAFARLRAGGALDRSFSGDGIARVPLPSDLSASVTGLALGPRGRVLAVAVVRRSGGLAHVIVVRLKADGRRDRSFGHRGLASVSRKGPSLSPYAIAVERDGDVLVGGETYRGKSDDRFLLRLHG